MRARIRKIMWIVILCIALLGIYVGYKYRQIEAFGRSIQPVKSDAIIVLGTQVVGSDPSPALRERLEWALALYRKHYAPKFILTGGLGGGSITEAEASQRYLMDKGIHSADIYLDFQSHDTWENLLNARAIMKHHSLHSAIIVSNDFHQERAQMFARILGMTTSGYGGHSQWLFNPWYTLREVIAISVETHSS